MLGELFIYAVMHNAILDIFGERFFLFIRWMNKHSLVHRVVLVLYSLDSKSNLKLFLSIKNNAFTMFLRTRNSFDKNVN